MAEYTISADGRNVTALYYIGTDSSLNRVDTDEPLNDLASMSDRERKILKAILEHTLARLELYSE